MWARENEANDTVDFWLLRQQTLAVQKACDVVSPAAMATTVLDVFNHSSC
jgi:hypothetical protein